MHLSQTNVAWFQMPLANETSWHGGTQGIQSLGNNELVLLPCLLISTLSLENVRDTDKVS
jgi:hypothetical protein